MTDVSPSGYGATCLDLSGKQASNAPKLIQNDGYFDRKNKALQIVTDNISAMANINHMGRQDGDPFS